MDQPVHKQPTHELGPVDAFDKSEVIDLVDQVTIQAERYLGPARPSS